MKILALCIGNPERLPGKSYKTGIFKHAVNSAVMIDAEGLVGDAICNRKHHGGVEPFPGEKVTMPELMETFGRELSEPDRARYLAAPIHYKLRAMLEAQC